MLMKMAENYDNEVDNTVSVLKSIMEPPMIVPLFHPMPQRAYISSGKKERGW